jgi:pyruvate,water dikinase
MTFLAELRAADARLGGKARSLAEMAAAGLATPAGFVITDDLFRAICPANPGFQRLDEAALASLDGLRAQLDGTPWPAGFSDELHGRLATLSAGSLAVRSSFASEDHPGRLAPGVYESRVDVPAVSVEQAIRDVLCSALAPGAVAYALAHGDQPARAPLAVLVHAYVAGVAEGSAALAPGKTGSTAEPLVTVRRGLLPGEARKELCAALASLAASRGPVEIEWVFSEGRVVYLQARSFEPPPAPVAWAGWADLGEAAARRALWRWDVSHNPLPLSPAQAGLVEIVDRSCSIGVRQRVLGGYLFCSGDERPLPPAIHFEDAEAFFSSLRSTVEARLAVLGPKPALEDALAIFRFAYQQIFGVLQPALREAQAKLRGFIEAHAPTGLALLAALRAFVPSMASERHIRATRIAAAKTREASERALAEYLDLFGDEAASWDVAAPTYAEEPPTLPACAAEGAPPVADWRRASAEVEGILEPGLCEEWRKLIGASRLAVSLAEADDWLFARSQAAIRRALLALGERLVADGVLADVADIFYLPFALVRGLASGTASSPGLASLAREGRKAWEAACRDPPPLPGTSDGKAVRGVGAGGRAIGRVVWHRPGFHHVGATDVVLVARTVLPTELPLLAAVAMVTETGELLDHVATQARERGIAAVVGAQGAMGTLSEGDLVLVDGDRGLVVRLD